MATPDRRTFRTAVRMAMARADPQRREEALWRGRRLHEYGVEPPLLTVTVGEYESRDMLRDAAAEVARISLDEARRGPAAETG